MAKKTDHQSSLPTAPIDRIVRPIVRFMHVEAAGGIVLLLATALALVLANSPWADAYATFWKTQVGFSVGDFSMMHSLKHWVSDGLMAIFFFVMGLEVKRELFKGELRDIRKASVPLAGALGGMVVPAVIYIALQGGEPSAAGWGIPMATDIAFVVGCMAILGPRIPHGLRVMLVSLAIVDDIGAILVIAIGYTDAIHMMPLLTGFGGLAVIVGLQRLGVRSIPVYVLVGTLVWFGFHESGVHATIAGVLLGLLTPTDAWAGRGILGDTMTKLEHLLQGEGWTAHEGAVTKDLEVAARESISPLERIENGLHPWVSFAIMPVFALANAGVSFEGASVSDAVSVAIIAALVIGKPLGIVLFTWLVIAMKLGRLPEGVGWGAITGGGFLAGIGFTMALFIAGLALDDEYLASAKIGVLIASAIAAGIGCSLLVATLKKPAAE
jgi:NhaA family Na+:H+ antiporter